MSEENKRYYWLKLPADFFGYKEIKKLRAIAGGDTYTIIYLKMLLRSMKDNGKLYYEGVDDDFVSELALDIDEDEDNVRVTVQFLLAKGILIENTSSEYEIATAKEMVGSECDSARRVRKLRAANAISGGQALTALHCNSGVTACNTEKEIDKEKEKEIEKDTDKRKPGVRASEIAEIVDYLNEKAGTHYKPTTDATKRHINARLAEGYTVDDFRSVIDKKCAEWMGGDMEKFLRPETLFGMKFESYLNAPARAQAKKKSSNPFLDMLRAEQAKVVEVESEVYPG